MKLSLCPAQKTLTILKTLRYMRKRKISILYKGIKDLDALEKK
jgi:hypothetical protein